MTFSIREITSYNYIDITPIGASITHIEEIVSDYSLENDSLRSRQTPYSDEEITEISSLSDRILTKYSYYAYDPKTHIAYSTENESSEDHFDSLEWFRTLRQQAAADKGKDQHLEYKIIATTEYIRTTSKNNSG